MMDYTQFLITTIQTLGMLLGGGTVLVILLFYVVESKVKILDQYRIKYGWDNEIEQNTSKKAYEKRIAKLEKGK